MKITIYQNREVYKEESKIGNDSENKVETLEFEFPEEYRDFTKYIEFQIKGEKYVDLIEDNKYVITREVAKYGKIKTQLVLKKNIENDVLIFKSNVFELNVSKSINASENLVSTVGVDLIEKIVTKNNEQDTRLNNLELDNTTNKENISNLQNDNTTNKTNIKSLQDDNKVNKTDISNIKQEQTTQNINISNLQTDNTSNKAKILDLEDKNTEQDTNIQKNTEDIAEIKEKDTAQDKLIEQLQAENTKLKKEINSMQIPGEATGNPIHLTDSSDMECEIIVVGNSEQETREGYNKLKLNTETSTQNGITSNYNENTIEFNGTNIAGGYLLNGTGNKKSIGSFSAGTYSFSAKNLSGNVNLIDTTDFAFYIKKSDGNNLSSISYNTNFAKQTFTINEETELFLSGYINNSDTTFTNYLLGFMLYEGVGEKPYEQYGASPSPDYPSKVVTVGQNVNIFDKDNANKINAWIDNSGYFQYSSDFKVLYIKCDRNKDYTVSSKYLRGIAFLNEVPKTGLTSTNFKIQNATELTLNSQDNTYLAVWYYATASGLTEEEILDSIKIVEGTKATAWSPYGQGSVEIEVCNENFFNFDKLTVTGREESEVTFDKELGKIEATASTSDSYLLKSFCIKGLEIGETYTIGFKHKTKNCTFGGNGVFRLSSTASYNSYDYGYVNGSTSETYFSKTFVAITDALTLSFLGVNGTAPGDTCTMYAKDIMLVKGATAKNYIQNQAQIKVLPIQKEFVKINDTEDTFVKVDGKWYEKHCISKEKFNGAENWENQWSGDRFAWRLTLDNIKTTGSADDKGFVISNYFKLYTQNELYQKSEHYGICNRTNQEQIIIKNDDTTSTADFKAYFAEKYANGTPVIVYYVLETPELIPCTAEQEAILNSFYTYKNITNISVDGIGKIKIIYKKDQQTINKNYEKRLATLEAAIIS